MMLMLRRTWALFLARNKEFVRDRSALGWNLAFPILIIVGFAFIFSGDGRDIFKVGVVQSSPKQLGPDGANIDPNWQAFLQLKHVDFVLVPDQEQALAKLRRHQFDMVVALQPPAAPAYWVNVRAPNGYMLERVLWGVLAGAPAPSLMQGGSQPAKAQRKEVDGAEIRYVDWVVPGVLAMNMMFSCLWGVGYVIVRYRKNLVLRRLKATPLSALEFLLAQIASRMLVVLAATIVVFVGTDIFLDFHMLGSYFDLFVVGFVGALCLVSLSMVVAARTASEEFANGILNLVSWPMMFLSGVWFSLEGAPDWVIALADVLPLTPLVDSARVIMTDGATLADVVPQVGMLVAMTAVFLFLGARLFRWD